MARKTRSKNLRSVDSLMKIPGLSATIIHHNKVSVLLVGLIVRLGTPREFVNFLQIFMVLSQILFFLENRASQKRTWSLWEDIDLRTFFIYRHS